MAFDLKSAKPIKRGFDLSSAKPVAEPSYAETAMGVVTDLPSTVVNIPGSAAKLASGIYEAVTSPIETVTSMADIGAGGIRNAAIVAERNGALPQGSVDFLDSLSDPAVAAAASEKAAAFGGVIADRWGSAEKIRTTLREDPVGFLADLATIATGVGGAARTAGLAGVGSKAAGVATAIDPLTLAGKGVSAVGQQINRMVPSQAGAVAQTAKNLLPKVVQQIETTGRRVLAGPKARALADITEGQDVNALIKTLEKPNVFPRTAAEAAASTGAAEYVALQQRLAQRGGTEAAKQAAKTKKAIETPIANIKGTPAQREAAIKRRSDMADPFYRAADAAFIPEDAKLRELLGRPEVAAAAREAANDARSEQRVVKVGETRKPSDEWGLVREENGRPIFGYTRVPGETAQYSGQYFSDIIQKLKDSYDNNPTSSEARNANRILKNTIDDLENWYEDRSPERKTARDLFKMYSRPVNRSLVGEQIFSALSPTTKRGESGLDFDAFARALEDEPATVSKALNWPSNMDFKKAGFSDADIKAIKAIDAERINKNLTEDLEKFGRTKAQSTVSEIYDVNKGPNFLNTFWTVFNTVKRAVGAKIGDKAIAELTLEALDPKLAAKALREMQKKLPSTPVRQMPGMPSAPAPIKGAAKIAGAVRAGARELPRPSSAALTAAGAVTNAMTQAREENPNVFLTDAYGRSYAYPPR